MKLNKDQKKRKGELLDKLQAAHSALEDNVNEYNNAMASAWAGVEVAVNDYNESLSEAQSFIDEINQEAQGEFDELSERSQQGDRGDALQNFISDYDLQLGDCDLDQPDDLTTPDDYASGVFEDLPEES